MKPASLLLSVLNINNPVMRLKKPKNVIVVNISAEIKNSKAIHIDVAAI